MGNDLNRQRSSLNAPPEFRHRGQQHDFAELAAQTRFSACKANVDSDVIEFGPVARRVGFRERDSSRFQAEVLEPSGWILAFSVNLEAHQAPAEPWRIKSVHDLIDQADKHAPIRRILATSEPNLQALVDGVQIPTFAER